MKIDMGRFSLAMCVAISSGVGIWNACNSNNAYKKAKMELRNTPGLSPEEYKEIIKPQNGISTKATEAYRLKNISDSLKLKAAMERAYHEGAQMVRDSLKAAAKTMK